MKQKQHIFQRQLRQANEELNDTYNKAIQKLEIEREELQAQRRNLSWD